MTVFIVQKPKPPGGVNPNVYDVSPAAEYGNIVFIFDAYENPSSNPFESLKKIRLALENFNSDTDYVISAGGDPYGLLLVGFVMNEMQLPLKWLRFERLRTRPNIPVDPTVPKQSGYYIPVEMPVQAYVD